MQKMYGPNNFATLYGIGLFLAACFNYLGYGLTYLAKHTLNGNFFWVKSIPNLMCAGVGIILVLHIRSWSKKFEENTSMVINP